MNDILQKKSKKISYLLRHNPEDLQMDKNGYVLIIDILKKLNLSYQELMIIIDENDKKRLSVDMSGLKIRATQGHSLKVDTELKLARPPKVLYHGTSSESFEKIKKSGGLSKMNRLHVHLSSDKTVAYSVGKRYSKYKEPIILEIDSASMYTDGYKFYLSENGVWLTDNVPLKYIK